MGSISYVIGVAQFSITSNNGSGLESTWSVFVDGVQLCCQRSFC